MVRPWYRALRQRFSVASASHVANAPRPLSNSSSVVFKQRFYQALTSSHPPIAPYSSPTNFASLPAGPGTATPLHSVEGDPSTRVTTFRVSEKEKTIVDEVQYKGWTVRLADWLHLSNPDDPSRPIVAHVFRCFLSFLLRAPSCIETGSRLPRASCPTTRSVKMPRPALRIRATRLAYKLR